jgi:hypothetical protein
MHIETRPPGFTLTPAAGGNSVQWRVGTLLSAIVRHEGGRLMLEIGGQRVAAESSLRLPEGTRVALKVTQTDPPRLQLQMPGASAPMVAAGLRQLLPLRPALAPLLSALNERAPPAALRTLRARLPEPTQLQSPHGLTRVARHSGMFFEALLPRLGDAARAEFAQHDFKALLLRALAQLRLATAAGAAGAAAGPEAPAPGQAAEAVGALERAVARLQLMQLQALTAERPDLLLEIPVRGAHAVELVQLRISEEAPTGGEDAEAAAPFEVRLAFQFGETGSFSANLRLAGNEVSGRWWTERAETAERLQSALPELGARLDAQGFSVGAMACSRGEPPVAIDELKLPMTGIVDEKA